MQLFGYHGYTQRNYLLFHMWPSFHTKRISCKFGQDRMSSFRDMKYPPGISVSWPVWPLKLRSTISITTICACSGKYGNGIELYSCSETYKPRLLRVGSETLTTFIKELMAFVFWMSLFDSFLSWAILLYCLFCNRVIYLFCWHFHFSLLVLMNTFIQQAILGTRIEIFCYFFLACFLLKILILFSMLHFPSSEI